MDDFLTKPVDSLRVERVLHQWIDGTDPETADDDGDHDHAADVVDVERFELLHEMVKEGVSLFQRSSGNFIAHAHDHLTAIRTAVDDADAEALTATAHKLKGSALNLGLPRVGHAAAELEEQGRAGRLEVSQAAYATLAREMEQALAALADARASRA